jgi:uncharacterized membrane protein YgcG
VRLGQPFAIVVAGFLAATLWGPQALADEGWLIERMEVRLEIGASGAVLAQEAVDVDFRGLESHGIFRDIHYRFAWDDQRLREYGIDLVSVARPDGRPHQVETSTEGALRRFRIGDPDRTLSGRESYRITYRIEDALNGFPDRDELYWNATGPWPVRLENASVTVTAPDAAITRVECFQGAEGSTQRCRSTFTASEAQFTATRALGEGEQLTVVVGLRKGAVTEPSPRLVARPRGPAEFFEASPLFAWLSLAGTAAAIAGVVTVWWRIGRDRRYLSLIRSEADEAQEHVPLFGARPIAVEFEPPEKLRAGQIGLLIDERADTLDVTATIVDLAVRGYVKITEIPKTGWFSSADWQLDRLKDPDDGLLEYEAIVFRGLFEADSSGTSLHPSRRLSQLKKKFHDDLQAAKSALYRDGVERGWFPHNPNTVRILWAVGGIALAGAGVALALMLGQRWGAGLMGVPIIAAGLLLTVLSRAMPRRTAAGREWLRHALGFARYIKTAEAQQHAFAERAHIFTEYLPYAIVFKCVDRWAKAFSGIDVQQAVGSWYVGSSTFNPASFSSTLGSFSSSVSTAIASTPGGSGRSGFGGSAGGGGGGGGGGRW